MNLFNVICPAVDKKLIFLAPLLIWFAWTPPLLLSSEDMLKFSVVNITGKGYLLNTANLKICFVCVMCTSRGSALYIALAKEALSNCTSHNRWCFAMNMWHQCYAAAFHCMLQSGGNQGLAQHLLLGLRSLLKICGAFLSLNLSLSSLFFFFFQMFLSLCVCSFMCKPLNNSINRHIF